MKKFQQFINESAKSIDTEYITNIFAEFIDEGSEYEYVDGSYFEIFIEIPGVRKNERKWKRQNKIEHYLEKSKQQTELLEDINVAINRIYDEFNILPEIKEEDYEHNETGLLVWCLHIIYEV